MDSSFFHFTQNHLEQILKNINDYIRYLFRLTFLLFFIVSISIAQDRELKVFKQKRNKVEKRGDKRITLYKLYLDSVFVTFFVPLILFSS